VNANLGVFCTTRCYSLHRDSDKKHHRYSIMRWSYYTVLHSKPGLPSLHHTLGRLLHSLQQNGHWRYRRSTLVPYRPPRHPRVSRVPKYLTTWTCSLLPGDDTILLPCTRLDPETDMDFVNNVISDAQGQTISPDSRTLRCPPLI
jgi:hypothetical protein